MQPPGSSSAPRRWKRSVAAGIGVAALAGGFATQAGPGGVGASSHREAPLIAGDPRADNTDVYAFVSPDKPDTVTLISNWIPFEEPNGGPNFYPFADDTRYNVKIDNDGDALADLTYTWIFDTVVRDASNQFLYNTGPVTSITDPDLNVYQTYDLFVTTEAGIKTNLLGNGDGVTSPGDPIAAPSLVGPGSVPDYAPLRAGATYQLPNGGGQTYAGQAEDPFFVDLRVFDLLYGGNLSELGEDTLAGYNVNSVALQVPKSALAINGNATTNPVIGIWSTTDRLSAEVAGDAAPDNSFVQVSRLGNPLVNEVVIPLSLKDAFNSISPDVDATVQPVVDKVLDPILPKVVQAVYGVPVPAAPRNDLFEIFLQGISKANAGANGDPATVLPVDLNSQSLNADAQAARGAGVPFRPSEMLRLNMSVPPTAKPNRLGVIGGDVQGFPNGRRLTDDVLDIAVQAVEGAARTGFIEGLAGVDSVDRNDREFGATFPYLALPHNNSVNAGPERSPRAPEFIPINPSRILETRSDQSGGQLGYTGARPTGGQTIQLKVTGVAGTLIPDDATTVFLNVTAVNTAADGFVTVFPCGSPRPTAANFNPIAGVVTHNLVAAKVGTGGNVCLYTSSTTDLVADIAGFHPSASRYVGVQPERLLETRAGEPGGQKGFTGASPGDGSTITLKVTQTGTANVPANATAVFLNLAAVNSTADGFVTVYPCGSQRPLAASLTLTPGIVRANLVSARIGTGGTVCLYVSKGTDLVGDLQGFVPSLSPFVSTNPERVLDTREEVGQVNYSASKPKAGQTTEIKVTGFGTTKIPFDAGTVLLNVSVVEASPDGFITVFPCGSPRPLAASLNLTGDTKTNLVVAKIGEGGRVCIYTSKPTHLVADIAGYFPGSIL